MTERGGKTTKISIKVEDVNIKGLIEQVVEGNIVIPSFQRDFIWEPRLVRDLFDSIYKGFPIGVLILWQPSESYLKKLIADSDYVFFHDAIREKALRENHQPKALVLDGHQRLTSIILPLYGWEIRRLGRIVADFKNEKVILELNDEKFSVGMGTPEDIDLAKIYQAYYLYNSEVLMNLLKSVSDEGKQKLDALAKKIFEYRVPVYTYITVAEDPRTYLELAEGFIRINKSGVKIGNVDLMSSLILGYEPDLNRSINDAFNKIKNGTAIDNKGLIIRLILKRIGLKQTDVARIPLKALGGLKKRIESAVKTDKLKALKKFIEEDVVNAFGEVQRVFEAKGLLSSDKLKLGDLIPSQTSLLPIVYYVLKLKSENLKLRGEDKDAMISWIILSSVRRWYVSNIDKKLEEDLNEIDEIARKGEGFETFVRNRLGRLRKISLEEVKEVEIRRRNDPWIFALHVLLSCRGADDWTGIKLSARNVNDISLHHIFPRGLKVKGINSLANITLINSKVNKELQDKLPIEYLDNYGNSLEPHLIPMDKRLWKKENFEEFIEERVRRLYDEWRKRFPLAFGNSL